MTQNYWSVTTGRQHSRTPVVTYSCTKINTDDNQQLAPFIICSAICANKAKSTEFRRDPEWRGVGNMDCIAYRGNWG